MKSSEGRLHQKIPEVSRVMQPQLDLSCELHNLQCMAEVILMDEWEEGVNTKYKSPD